MQVGFGKKLLSSVILYAGFCINPTANADAKDLNLTPENILTLFPICETGSSLGQRCKFDFKDDPPRDFLEVCCKDGHRISRTETSVEVFSASGWLYRFDLSPVAGNFWIVSFEDKGMKGATYHTVTKFLAHIDEGELNLWKYSVKRYDPRY